MAARGRTLLYMNAPFLHGTYILLTQIAHACLATEIETVYARY